MPSNVFNPQLSDVSANTFIQDTKVSTVAADAFTLLANTGVEVGKSIAIDNLTGGSGSPSEVEGDASLLPDIEGSVIDREKALGSISDLKKLSAARKAGLPLAQAKSRATTILKTAINDNPFFADDIRKEYKTYFGGSGSDIFKMTPQEEAVAKYQQERAGLALKLQVSEDVAGARMKSVEETTYQKQQMELKSSERALNGDDYVFYAQASASLARTNMSSAIIAEYNANGTLSPESVASFKQQLPLLESQLHDELFKLQKDENGQPQIGRINAKARENARREIDDTINSLKGLIDDSAMQKIVSENQSIIKDNYDIAVVKHFGALKAVKDVMGEDTVKYIFQSMRGNKAWTQIVENEPFFAEIVGRTGNFEKDSANWVGVGAKALFGSFTGEGVDTAPTTKREEDEQAAGVIALMSSNKGAELLTGALRADEDKSSVIAQAITKSPGALFNFTKPEYEAKIQKNPEVWKETIGKSIEGVKRNTLARYMISQGGIPNNFDIQALRDTFSPNKTTDGEITSSSRIRATGDGVDETLQSNINTIYKVANKYPMLWKGQYESSLDYIRSIFNLERGVRLDERSSK